MLITLSPKKRILNKDSLNGTCVIDNFIGMYGEEFKIKRDDFIKLHQKNYKNIYAIITFRFWY